MYVPSCYAHRCFWTATSTTGRLLCSFNELPLLICADTLGWKLDDRALRADIPNDKLSLVLQSKKAQNVTSFSKPKLVFNIITFTRTSCIRKSSADRMFTFCQDPFHEPSVQHLLHSVHWALAKRMGCYLLSRVICKALEFLRGLQCPKTIVELQPNIAQQNKCALYLSFMILPVNVLVFLAHLRKRE